MGFGSYDESEQENQDYDTDLEDSEGVNAKEHDHKGEVSFDFEDSSSDELLDQFQQMKDDRAEAEE
ncbi:DUF5786 family protein [Halosegnis marinus]|uniref:DUF5786 family protein n=1 Tax=Halosegnis marinus TaxID=3034023 RepID=A0ABD5ZQ07_9EURY|nr:DUF5786 family protein [Halosegnis sp. DT85]